MTTIAAVKKGKCISIASDSLTLFGSRKEESSAHVHDSGKIIEIGANLIGITGHPSWGLILMDYFSKKKTGVWQTSIEIFALFNDFHKELKDRYYFQAPSLNFFPFESSEWHFLIVNPFGIFEIDYARAVRQHTQYCAIGTGEEYALGAIYSLYHQVDDPDAIACLGIEAAIQFDRKSGGTVQSRKFTIL